MKETRVVRLNNYEHRVMVAVLNTFRNEMIQDEKPTEDVDDLLLKVIDAPLSKGRKKDDL